MVARNGKAEKGDKVFVKVARACGPDGLNERWAGCETSPTLNVFDNMGDIRAVVLIVERRKNAENSIRNQHSEYIYVPLHEGGGTDCSRMSSSSHDSVWLKVQAEREEPQAILRRHSTGFIRHVSRC